jgi:sugar lactone lactonase YvrE
MWQFDQSMIFPSDRSLKRPEDGVALADGRMIVADQVEGLRIITPDGAHHAFGKMKEAGYRPDLPDNPAGANGVSLEPSGSHVLVADVYHGGLYRVDIATEETEKIYQHPHGINTARRDTRGGIWFTQSTKNDLADGEKTLWRAIAQPVADGALYYLPPKKSNGSGVAVQVADGFQFANGIALDEKNGHLYLAETLAGRVLRFKLDVSGGRVSEQSVFYDAASPVDNLELDENGRLWVALPVRNAIVVTDTDKIDPRLVLRISTPESERLMAEIESRQRTNQPWLELFTPAVWEPAPGAITGIILTPKNGSLYVTGLGDALIKLER